jgi:hypothetical protein
MLQLAAVLLDGFGWESLIVGGLVALLLAGAEEWWKPTFPPEFESGLIDGDESPIVFEGIVTAPGSFGYDRLTRRQVQIVRVLQFDPRRRRRCPYLPYC